MTQVRIRLAILTTHVIQYQDPFFALLAAEPDLDVTVIFCSPLGFERYRDEDMSTTFQWDLDLLRGYKHEFLRNLSTQGTKGGFWRAVNPSVSAALTRDRFDAVLFMLGWGVFTAWLGFAACIRRGLPFLLYGDSSFLPSDAGVRGWLRRHLLRGLFARASGFMISGALNADYYRHYGADQGRFFPLPWAIDNGRFERDSRLSPEERSARRSALGFGTDQMVVVFSGKLIERKDPMIVLTALERMKLRDRTAVLYLGDGPLRGLLERHALERGLGSVRFAGFVNQAELPKLYGLADVFVLPSRSDPRATVVNEAMACGLPVVVSDCCGPAADIARNGHNAFVIPAGDVDALADRLDSLAADPARRLRMGGRSLEVIGGWSYAAGVAGVKQALKAVAGTVGAKR